METRLAVLHQAPPTPSSKLLGYVPLSLTDPVFEEWGEESTEESVSSMETPTSVQFPGLTYSCSCF